METNQTESARITAELNSEETQMFEELKYQDVRNTSDMVRFLIRQEWMKRKQLTMTGFANKQTISDQFAGDR